MADTKRGIEAWLPEGSEHLFAVDRADVHRIDLHDNEAMAAECDRQLRAVHDDLERELSKSYFGIERRFVELPAQAKARRSMMRRVADRIAAVLRGAASRLDGYPANGDDE